MYSIRLNSKSICSIMHKTIIAICEWGYSDADYLNMNYLCRSILYIITIILVWIYIHQDIVACGFDHIVVH